MQHWSTPGLCPWTSLILSYSLLFSYSYSPVSSIAAFHKVSQQQYADDTQLFIALSQSNSDTSMASIQAALMSLYSWFSYNGLTLNPEKSDTILREISKRNSSLSHVNSVNIAGTQITLSYHLKVLGVTLDSNLYLNKHVSSICRSNYFHLRALPHIRYIINDDIAKSIGQALVSSRLDYANGILYGVSQFNINKLQKVQNTLARVVLRAYNCTDATPLLAKLHRLPIERCILFKQATLTFKSLDCGQPSYLSVLLERFMPARALWSSSDATRLAVSRSKTRFGSRAFLLAHEMVWNSLPVYIRTPLNLSSFRRHLKTFYFSQSLS